MSDQGWIGVDLDGTLAHYDRWRGHTHIGAPIAPMVRRIQLWLTQGKDVRLFTARAAATGAELEESVEAMGVWCDQHIGRRLAITCTKDYQMLELWDDRCKQIIPNTGIAIEDVADGLIVRPADLQSNEALRSALVFDDVARGQRL